MIVNSNPCLKLMKRLILLLYAGVFCSFTSLTGQTNIDSLLSLLKTAKEDTLKIRIRAQIGEEIPVLRITYWDSIRVDAEKWDLKKIKAQAINNMGYVSDDLGDITKALEYYNESLVLRREIDDKRGMAESLNNIAVAYEKQGDIPHALEYQFNSLKIQEEIADREGMSLSLNNIAYIYEHQDDIPNALEYYRKSLKIAEELKDNNLIATHENNIAEVYRKLALKPGNSEFTTDSILDVSNKYFLSALSLFEETNDRVGIATIYQNLGEICQDRNDQASAMQYLNKSLEIWEEINNKRGITFIRNTIGELYFSKKDYSKAFNHGSKALFLARELGYPKEISISADLLSRIYQVQGRWDEAFRMQALYFQMRDSINNDWTRRATVQKQFQYEYDKKEALLKAEQEKERAVAREKSRKQKIIILSIIGGLVTVLIFAAYVFRSLQVTRRQKKIIEEKNRETEFQKKIIEEKNKDITDSINYAKRIQQAKLPAKEEIYHWFPRSFVLFKPKDIVSGDFYFFRKTDRSLFIAAADCTGHGVPGAFMSLIASEKLEEAITLSTDTSEILKHVNRGIRNSLHQSLSNESTRDGMDIALCSVDPANLIMKFSGANRPVWIIRNGNSEVEEISATRKAIGGLTEDHQEFETHELKLQSGDTFYLFSDGYSDTTGGEKGKKLKTKKFKEILLSIQGKDMREQEKYLENFIETWKAGMEQIDDILVIGVRIG
jgi:serine phosphatase RsbU (regulator of sigma subunit)/Tfp pilus assembly protein PilF